MYMPAVFINGVEPVHTHSIHIVPMYFTSNPSLLILFNGIVKLKSCRENIQTEEFQRMEIERRDRERDFQELQGTTFKCNTGLYALFFNAGVLQRMGDPQ